MEPIKFNLNDPSTVTKENIDAAVKAFAEGVTLREMRALSDAEMEAIYSMGVNFYKTGNYTDAEKVFKFLVMFDHLNSRYWTALGSLRQVQRKFADAVEAYKFASFLDMKNPRPLYYVAECLLALGQKDEALSALAALDGSAPADSPFRAKAAALREHLVK